MRDEKAVSPAFFLTSAAPRLRHDDLLNHAVEAFAAGRPAEALLAAEQVCRALPAQRLPAMLRAAVIGACRPELGARAWYQAWLRAPQDMALQDAMLTAWLDAGAGASVAALGPAFLAQRCRTGAPAALALLLTLLRRAGLGTVGACWKSGAAIEGMVFGAPGSAATARLLVAGEDTEVDVAVPADGSRFRFACPRPLETWSLAWRDQDTQSPASLLAGSPLAFAAPGPALAPLPAPSLAAASRPLVILIPVYRGLATVQACLGSVLASLAHNRRRAEVFVIDDASAEPGLPAWLDELAARRRITLARNRFNLGFIETCNRGLRARPGHDVLLLNADTLVHGDWFDRLGEALGSAADIAAVTPWSNNGEISSFPRAAASAMMPTPAQLVTLDSTAAALRCAGATGEIELPSCCGFAMLMGAAALERVGLLDGAALERGYGEEVDWCLRARAAGYRHLLASGVFVAHAGGASFGMEKALRVRQNRAVLAARHPDYYRQYQRFLADDPLAAPRAALGAALELAHCDWLRAVRAPQGAGAVPFALPAALAGACARIAVRRDGQRVEVAVDAALLQLARLIASRSGAGPALRLLVLGQASEALWRTGVVDVLPAQEEATAAPLLTDAALAGMCGCVAQLDAGAGAVLPGLPCTRLDARFDARAWLARRFDALAA